MKKDVIMMAEYLTRSAMEPVGMVTVVSMKTIWKKNNA